MGFASQAWRISASWKSKGVEVATAPVTVDSLAEAKLRVGQMAKRAEEAGRQDFVATIHVRKWTMSGDQVKWLGKDWEEVAV